MEVYCQASEKMQKTLALIFLEFCKLAHLVQDFKYSFKNLMVIFSLV